jgi:hypothetical protein
MSLSVQIHPEKFEVTLYPEHTHGRSFVTVKAFEAKASVSLFLPDADAADKRIIAATEAKRLLSPLACGHVAPPALAGYACDLPPGHDGEHEHAGSTWYANPAHHATPAGEAQCKAEDNRYFCTAQLGHDGPEHIAYGSAGEVCHRWPVEAADAANTVPRVSDILRDVLDDADGSRM